MKATQYSFDQISHFRMLLEQRDVSPDLLQEFYDSGVIADLLEVRKPKSLDREAVKKALGLKPLNPPLLEPLGTVNIAATGQFVAQEKFVVNTSRKAKVKIAYLGSNFQRWFLDKIETPAPEVTLRYAKLIHSALDDEIRKEIGAEHEETILASIYALMERQKYGKPELLLTNGYANIFYVRDASGILRAVDVRWDSDDDGWGVLTDSVEHPGRWYDGRRVFSRNS